MNEGLPVMSRLRVFRSSRQSLGGDYEESEPSYCRDIRSFVVMYGLRLL